MLNLFVLMLSYESVHVNLLFLKSKHWQFTGPLRWNTKLKMYHIYSNKSHSSIRPTPKIWPMIWYKIFS